MGRLSELPWDCYSEPAAIIGEERRGKASQDREIHAFASVIATPQAGRAGNVYVTGRLCRGYGA